MDQRRYSRVEGQRSTEDSGPEDRSLTQEDRGRYQTKGFQLGSLVGLAFLGANFSPLSAQVSYVADLGNFSTRLSCSRCAIIAEEQAQRSWSYRPSGAGRGSSGLRSCNRPFRRCWWRDRPCARYSWHKT